LPSQTLDKQKKIFLSEKARGEIMYTSALIKRHINQLEKSTIFSTRAMLNYGTRAAVDQCLYRLVKSGRIIRLAWGLFTREDSNNASPSHLEIATEKARAFTRKILTDGIDRARAMGLTKVGNKELVFATDGCSSAFRSGQTQIHFKAISLRKMSLENSALGQVIRALWHLGKEDCTAAVIAVATSNFTHRQYQELRHSAHLMPDWMTSRVRCFRR
jgi:Family of unknown function (DUF6088)